MARKSKDPYAGWTHDDFNKEAEELTKAINRSIRSINHDYRKGKRPDMDGPLDYLKFKDE
ncbi:MAG: hypothetical protein LUE31_09115 [Lachnospiraceae bacterium]|nr:hypothetical protein [Lachnospiraceae bacterium]